MAANTFLFTAKGATIISKSFNNLPMASTNKVGSVNESDGGRAQVHMRLGNGSSAMSSQHYPLFGLTNV